MNTPDQATSGPAAPEREGGVFRVPGMPALLLATLAGFTGYGLLLPVAPLWAVQGGAGEGGSGLVNGVVLLCTVLTQPFVPGLLRRHGWGVVLAVGLTLLGLPALAHPLSADLGVLLALSAVRGVGFGVITVTGSAAVAELVDASRRGSAVGAYGLAIAVPQVLVLPFGPVAAEHLGFGAVFVAAACPLLGVPAALALGRSIASAPNADGGSTGDEPGSSPDDRSPARIRATLPPLLPPMLILLGVTLAGGAVLTFAPQMTEGPVLAMAALAALGGTAAVTRWRIGGLADRHGARPFVWPLVVLAAASTALLAHAVRAEQPWLLLLAAAALGVAYGGLQNLTLVLSFDSVTRERYGMASAVWNIGFDLGTGLGSVLVGAIAALLGFPAALLVAAAVTALTLPLSLLGRHPARRA